MINFKNKLFFLSNSNKFPLFGKICVTLIMVFSLQIATNMYSQNANVSLNFEQAPLGDVLNRIENNTEYVFFYRHGTIDLNTKITIHAQNRNLQNVLSEIFRNTGIEWTVKDKLIILGRKDTNDLSEMQGITVAGTVTDDTGESIPGVNVMIKGTKLGTITDVNGKYSITVPDKNSIIVFSFIGYSPQEIMIGDKNTVNVNMIENTLDIGEVVVVGYGTMQRKNFTGSVSTVNIETSPSALTTRTNIMDMLRGNVTGVTISRETYAGSTPDIQVHGQKSVSGSSTPLVVLDGVIYMGGWRDIDPVTIESISVLKDATSLAAYGSQAANGVIMITSKKGKLGKPVISFDGSLGISHFTLLPKMQSLEDYVAKSNFNMGVSDPSGWLQSTLYENYKNGQATDWVDYATRTGITQNYSLSVSGATDRMNYFMSLSHTDQLGVIKGDQFSRNAVTIRLQNDITDWLQAGAQVNYAYNNYDGIAATLKPVMCPYGQPTRPNGDLEKYAVIGGDMNYNPLWDVESGARDDYDRYSTTFLKGHLLVKVPWINGLSYRMNYAYSEENYKRNQFFHELYYVGEGEHTNDARYAPEVLANYLTRANGSMVNRSNTYYVFDNILNYTAQFGKHFVDLTGVYTRDEFVSNTQTMSGADFSGVGNTLLGYNGLQFSGTQMIGQSISRNSWPGDGDTYVHGKTRKANIAYLARLIYAYDERFHLTASVRRDGSSVFGANTKWGVFPTVGVAWTVSNESFMNADQINFLKAKVSWGKNGNQSLNPYETISTINLGRRGLHAMEFGDNTIGWGQYVSVIGNPELGWESTTGVNSGLEIGLLKDRIHFELDVYKSQTTDQIFNRTIPIMANGFERTKATMGQVDNWGVEFTLQTENLKNRDFEWLSMLNFYLNRNKLVDLYGDGKDDIASSLFIGKSLGAIYGYQVIGIVQEEDTEYITANTVYAGFPKYANLDGSVDGVITPDDRTILGYNKENFRMNMSHTLSYKNWTLNALFMGIFSGGGYGMTSNPNAYLTNSGTGRNLDHPWWTSENRSNLYPTPSFNGNNYTPLQSYAFIRLQDLSLSYSFRQQVLHNIGISRLRTYISVKNLFTITNWVGGDPENRQTINTYNLTTIPLQKTFSFGFNLSF